MKQRLFIIDQNRWLRRLPGLLRGSLLAHVLTGLLCFAVAAGPSRQGFAEQDDEIACLKEECFQLKEQSKWVPAISVAEILLDRTTQKFGEMHSETFKAMNLLGWLVNCTGDHSRAEEIWRKAFAFEEITEGNDEATTASTLRMLGNLCSYRGDSKQATELLERALQILRRQPTPCLLELGKVYHALGSFYLQLGDLSKARPFVEDAVDNFERLGAGNEEDLARALLGQAHIFSRLGESKKVTAILDRVVGLQEKTLGSEHAEMANTVRSLAFRKFWQMDLPRAEELFQRSLAIEEKVFDPTEDYRKAYTLVGLGQTYLALGEWDKARINLKRALRVAMGYPWETSIAKFGMGELSEREGDYHTAESFFEEAYRFYDRRAERENRFAIVLFRAWARMRFASAQYTAALALAGAIQEAEEKEIANILSFASENERLAFQSNFLRDRFHLWATMGAADPLAQATFRSKGIVLDSLLEDRLLARASGDVELKERVDRLNIARQRFAQMRSNALDEMPQGPESESRRTQLGALSAEIDVLEGALARKVAGLGHARNGLLVDAKDVQKAITKRATLLEFLKYNHYVGRGRWEENYGALVLSQLSGPSWVRLGPAGEIEKNVNLCQHLMRQNGTAEALTSVLRELHDQLWRPLREGLPSGTSEIIISPDGELNFVSFAALLTPAQEFLGERYSISYVSSGRDLLCANRSATPASALLVWANPDFETRAAEAERASRIEASSGTSSLGAFRGLSFHRIPGAESEALLLRDLAPRFGVRNVVMHLGKQATEAELSQVQSPFILHLATHGFVLPNNGVQESLHESQTLSSGCADNPMLRSGLALAGAQRTLDAWARGEAVPPENDGIVTAEEIGTLNLQNTWLVVLSACDTGRGEARSGEGVLGLRRGFIQAGAQNLLMTLWPIDDKQTVSIIGDFYASAARSRNAAQALADVQRSWLVKLRKEKGVGEACRIVGPFILSSRGTTAP